MEGPVPWLREVKVVAENSDGSVGWFGFGQVWFSAESPVPRVCLWLKAVSGVWPIHTGGPTVRGDSCVHKTTS